MKAMSNRVRRDFWSVLKLALAMGLLPFHASTADDTLTRADEPGAYAVADEIFRDFMLDAHTPGLVFGVVTYGKLVHIMTSGVQDLETRVPITPAAW